MYKRILLAYDGSEPGQRALLDCSDLVQWSQADLVLVAVMPPATTYLAAEAGLFDDGRDAQELEKYKGILDDGLRRLAESGHKATGEVVVGESVAQITGYAQRIEADLIVVGHKHLGSWAARWWRGSTSPSLIEHAHCSVLCVITD